MIPLSAARAAAYRRNIVACSGLCFRRVQRRIQRPVKDVNFRGPERLAQKPRFPEME